MNPNMAAVHSFILFQMFFGFLHQGLALISDYKLCGDPECESKIFFYILCKRKDLFNCGLPVYECMA